MNSRERRKLAALQHNDEIRYVNWLKTNAIYSSQRQLPYEEARKAGMSRLSALNQVKLFAAMNIGVIGLTPNRW